MRYWDTEKSFCKHLGELKTMVCSESPWAAGEGSRGNWSEVRKKITYIVLNNAISSEGD